MPQFTRSHSIRGRLATPRVSSQPYASDDGFDFDRYQCSIFPVILDDHAGQLGASFRVAFVRLVGVKFTKIEQSASAHTACAKSIHARGAGKRPRLPSFATAFRDGGSQKA